MQASLKYIILIDIPVVMEGNFVKMSSRDSHFGIMNRVAGMIRVASMEVGSASFVIHLTGNKIMQVIG